MGSVLGIAVAEVVLHRSQIRALVGEVVAAGMPEHMGPDPAQVGLFADKADYVVDGLARHELVAELIADRDQLWAEAAHLEKEGEPCQG